MGSLLVLGVYFVIRGMYGGANTIDYALAIPTDSSIWISLSSGWFYIIHALRWIYPFGQQGLSIVFIPEEQKALVIISAFIVVNLGIFIVWLRTRQPRLALGLVWYAISLFPMANVVPLKNGPICDYYLFFPSIGLILVGAELYRLLKQTRYQNLLLGTSVAWLGLFIITTALWVPHWKSRTALAERTLEWQTDNYVMLAFLGEEALLEGDLESSKPLLEKALQDAPIDLKYRHHIEYLLALWAGKSGQLNEAASQLESILESHRSSNTTPPIHYLVQAAYIYDVHLDQTRKAESYLKSALDAPWDGNFSKDAAIRLADIYIKTHRTSQAIELLGFLAANYPGNDEIIQKFRAIQGIASINSPTHFAVQEK